MGFVGLDDIGERFQFALLWTVLGAAHEHIRPRNKQGMHAVGHSNEMRHRSAGLLEPECLAFLATDAMAELVDVVPTGKDAR